MSEQIEAFGTQTSAIQHSAEIALNNVTQQVLEIEMPQFSEPLSYEATPTEARRLSGTRWTVHNVKQVIIFHKEADEIGKLAEVSRKRATLAEKILNLYEKKPVMAILRSLTSSSIYVSSLSS